MLTWCAANAVVEMDAARNLKVNRRKSTEKIDGIVALAMAVGRWMAVPVDRVTEPGARGCGAGTTGWTRRKLGHQDAFADANLIAVKMKKR